MPGSEISQIYYILIFNIIIRSIIANLRKFLSPFSESVELNNDESQMFSRILIVKIDFSVTEANI